ncbi:hypothetical protein [Rhodopirellula bahusiensis]|uniref:hypothetical protein n=1 Tax=Rhodopirellula bahusiensis TaxID=2014065 RepID=UPI003263638A
MSTPLFRSQSRAAMSVVICVVLSMICGVVANAADGVSVVAFHGYEDCLRLSNEDTVVTLCPAAGGRVLEYSVGGTNVLYLDPEDAGWTLEQSEQGQRDRRGQLSAGRFDIGPEMVVQRGNMLWNGRWDAEIVGDRSVKMTSQYDSKSGARLTRIFELAEKGSHLRCTQTIANESERPISLCHWSRTFAVGGGIVLVPRSGPVRFPRGYVRYENGLIRTRPNEPNIQVDEDAVVVSATPEFPKLGFDSHAGWLAYLSPTNQLFVKRFPTFPERSYNELAGLTVSVWYPEKDLVELEPIGPAENLDPGESADFTEDWYLTPFAFPVESREMDRDEVERQVQKLSE